METGKQADLAAFTIEPHHAPVTDPHVALAFGPRMRAARVVVAGRERVRDGRVIGLDAAVAGRVQAAAAKAERWRRTQPPG